MNLRARLAVAVAAGLAAVALPAMVTMRDADRKSASLPPPAIAATSQAKHEVAVLAGGCFWGVEAVFEHVRGVIDVRSGYAGGDPKAASYAKVSGGRTGNAEAVRIVFNPSAVTYGQLLHIYFAVAHDPTQLNRQGPDVGPQYRSAIFPQSAAQQRVARAYIAQLGKDGAFNKPIATRLEQGRFVEAEAYHQDFMSRNPAHPYILLHDRPKLAALKRQFPSYWRA